MVVVGSDVHKRTHTFVVADERGRKLAEVTVKADPKGHDKAICWVRERFGTEEVLWAIEDCRHLSARLELDLLDAGEQVEWSPAEWCTTDLSERVPPTWARPPGGSFE